MNQEHVATANGRSTALIVIFIACIPLAHSGDFLEAATELAGRWQPWNSWLLIFVDILLLTLIGLLTRKLWPRLGVGGWRACTWWAGGALLTIALDIVLVLGLLAFDGELGVWIDLGSSLLYAASLAMIIAGIVGASPIGTLTQRGRIRTRAAQEAWERYRPAIPLLVGTLAAYVASTVWARLNESATRIGDQAAGVIHQEYFAQLSQVIPLLLVAIGLEAHFFERLLAEPVQRAMTIVSIVILCLGEALAISALPTDNEGRGDVLHGWHEYSAFVLSVQGVVVALAILVWALIDASPRSAKVLKDG